MKTLIHISDLHFGKINHALSKHLSAAFATFNSDLVIISGDLTQRATKTQFIGAQELLEDIKKEGMNYFVIPGNHDIEPMFTPLKRVATPYINYQKYISDELQPRYSDDEIAIAAVNTVSRFNIKAGVINQQQIDDTVAWFDTFPDTVKKIIVTHHPVDLPNKYPKRKLVPRASKALETFAQHGVDLYLSGHYHRSSVIIASERFNIKSHAAVAVQAGTLSLRGRGEVQSFNVIKIDRSTIHVETYSWDAQGNIFNINSKHFFEFKKDQWRVVGK